MIVFQMIQKSSLQDRFSTYSISYLIHSWKSVPLRRVRWICHNPVIPGRTLSRASRHGGQYWFSPRGLGRGPTTDISLPRYRFAYVASFTNSFVQVIDLDNSEPNKATFETVVYTLGTPSVPKGNQ